MHGGAGRGGTGPLPPPAARTLMTLDEGGGIGQAFTISPGSAAAEIFERLHYEYLALEAQNTSLSREVIAGVEFLRIDIQPFAAEARQLRPVAVLGPAGSGKTSAVEDAVRAVAARGAQVLIPRNADLEILI